MFYDPFKSQSRASSKRATEIRVKVVNRLGRFGESVVNLVVELALTPHRMHAILERLHLSSHMELDGQLDAIAYYVAQSGAQEFVSRVSEEIAASNRETTQINHPRATPDAFPDSRGKISTGKYLRSVVVDKAEKKSDAQPAAPEEQAPKGDVGILEEAVAAISELEEKYPDVDPANVVIHELAWIESPNYTGPDRRTGPPDRRTHRERRGTVGSVMKNRRFGADRRHLPRGRRQSDHAKKN